MKTVVLLLLIPMWSCTYPPTNTYLKHRDSIILHDDRGKTFVLTHISGDKWELQ
jgi:hypothetical protein